MRYTICLSVCLTACVQPTDPTKLQPPLQSRQSKDVAWRDMIRDRSTVNAYTGKLVRFHLARTEFVVEGRTLRVNHSDPNVPPTLFIDCPGPVPAGNLVVEGECGAPVVDGIKRSRYVDFFMRVNAYTVTAVP